MSHAIRKLVVKLGTKVLAPSGALDQNVFEQVAFQTIDAQKLGTEIIIVSSGGILAGRERAKKLKLETSLLENDEKKRYLAGIGARHLLNFWGRAFEKYGLDIGQIWITHGNLDNTGENESIKSAIKNYHSCGVIPIINENDVVSSVEVDSMKEGKSENDRLAHRVAQIVNADSILFLTNVGGVYEQNPDSKLDTRRFSEIDIKTAEKLAALSNGTTEHGTGGMNAKLCAAVQCYRDKNMKVCIASVADNAILKFVRNENVGTLIGKSVRFW